MRPLECTELRRMCIYKFWLTVLAEAGPGRPSVFPYYLSFIILGIFFISAADSEPHFPQQLRLGHTAYDGKSLPWI